MRCQVSWESPASMELTMKTPRATCTNSLRSKRSASLPQIGVVTVVASSDAVTTQV
jgi:hypothetical protein